MNTNIQSQLRNKIWNYDYGFTEQSNYEPYYNKTNPNTKCMLKLQAWILKNAVNDGTIDPYTPWVSDNDMLTAKTQNDINGIKQSFNTIFLRALGAWNGDPDGDASILAAIKLFEDWVETSHADTQDLNLATKNMLVTELYVIIKKVYEVCSTMPEKKPAGTVLNALTKCCPHIKNVVTRTNPEMLWLLYPAQIIRPGTAIDPLP
jgi:hypothetical protein